MTSGSNTRTPLVEVVVGKVLEWMVSSVEGIRARLNRNGTR